MNIDEVVKRSGVSRSTVFRFLKGDNVRATAKMSIISAMQQLGYNDEKAVNSQLNLEIEISASEDMNDFLGLTQVIDGITYAAKQRGVKVRIVRRGASQINADYDNWDNGQIGVVVIGKNIHDEKLEAQKLLEHNIPHVFINRILNDNSVSYVAVDVVQAGYDITKYLIDKGHKKIAICGDVSNYRVDRDKIAGYQNALLDNGIKISDKLCITNANKYEIELYISKLFENGEKPDAFVGICDTYAMKFIGIAEQNGYKVPDDIAVVGMDDVASGEFFRPALTTVHIPFYEMGILAVDSLLKQTSQNVKSIRTIVNHSIIVRNSCYTISHLKSL